MAGQGNHLSCDSYADWYKSESAMWLKGSQGSSRSPSSHEVEFAGVEITKKMKKKGFYRNGGVIYFGSIPA